MWLSLSFCSSLSDTLQCSPRFWKDEGIILLKHHSISVLSSTGKRRRLGMLFVWMRRRLIELRSNICHPDLRKYLCLSRHYTPFVCHLFPSSADWWDFTPARFGRLCFVCLLLPCHPCKQTHAPHTAWCIHRAHTDYHLLWMHQKGQSIQLALQISTSYVLWQHQMSAPKWTASVQQYMRSNAWEEETRLWNGPSEPGPWACIANAATSPSAKAALGFCPRTCCSA